MTPSEDVAVTYSGTDDPFIDRIYRSGLTFTPRQTRVVPAALAARFLQHADVFKRADAGQGEPKPDPKAKKAAEPKKDDTAQQLEDAKVTETAQREQDEARFALLDSIGAMDREALATFAEVHYQQKIHHKLGLEKARDMVRGFIDQYGMPA